MESADHSLHIGNPRVYAYAQSGRIIYCPLPKPWPDLLKYFDLVDITLSPGQFPINGPGLDASAPEHGGEIDSLTVGSIPWARSLAYGTSTGTLSGKLLSASFGTYFYIQEPGMPLGIRVAATPPNAPLGELLSIVGGTMGTVNGERVILSSTQVTDELTTGTLRKVGVSHKQMSGQPIIPPSVGWTVSVTGISSVTPGMARLLRVRNQADMGLFQPEDTTDPEVSITNPPDDQVYIAPGATSVTIAGEAGDADTMVVSVAVKIGSGEWQAATYDSVTHNWSFVWQNPQSTTITARATDFAGNSATASRSVSIVTYDASWLTMSAYATRYDEVQASWTYPNQVSTLKYAVGTAPCRDDVYPWTATGSPTATQVTVTDLDLEDNTTYYFSLKGLDAGGNLDRIGSCSFVTDLGADSIELEASPSTDREIGDSVTITATLTDCRENAISGRSIAFETMGVHNSTATAATDSSGQASVTFSCNEEGWVNVVAHEYQPSLANVEESIDIEFRKPPLIEVLFVMEGNVWGFYNDLARDAVLELESLSSWYGVPIKFGGLSFDDIPCDHSYLFTDDYYDFNDWLLELENNNYGLCDYNGVAWEALGALAPE